MTGIVQALVWKARFDARLTVLEAQPTAESQGKTECCRSGVCCWRRPCLLGAGDPKTIAAHLGLSPQALFRRFLVVDEVAAGLFLVPRRHQQQGGRYLSAKETYEIDSPCAFLAKNNDCTIHAVKPQGGRLFKCWDASTQAKGWPAELEWTEEKLRALGWDGERR